MPVSHGSKSNGKPVKNELFANPIVMPHILQKEKTVTDDASEKANVFRKLTPVE